MKPLRYRGSKLFRYRILLALLVGKPIRIEDIRAMDREPGISDFEASLLRLVDKVTNGTTVEINHTGTSVYLRPGILTGGKFKHDCGKSRGVGYFIEFLILLAPFCKNPIEASLLGITNSELDHSVDAIRLAVLPQLEYLGLDPSTTSLVIDSRGWAPHGGGKVTLTLPCARQLQSFNFTDPGMVKCLRGVCYSSRCPPVLVQGLVSECRGQWQEYCDDIHIATDVSGGGLSPGYGLTLVAELTSGSRLQVSGGGKDAAEQCWRRLQSEIVGAGCVTSSLVPMFIVLMAVSPQEVSSLAVGPLSTQAVETLRLVKHLLGVTFRIEKKDSESPSVTLTCMGAGLKNLAKKVT